MAGKPVSPKRQLMLRLRRRLTKVHRRFDVVDLGEGRVQLTCQTCGTVTEEIAGSQARAGAPEPGSFAAKFYARWWSGKTQNGITGNCPVCLQAERDSKYPLPTE